MVTYHYVKFDVSIIIQLEVININVRNFKFTIGFYSNPHPLLNPKNIIPQILALTMNVFPQFHSNPHPLWTPKNMALTPFTTNLKTLGSTRNIYL